MAREPHTRVFSMPYFLWNIQSVCNLPMKALVSCHWNCNFWLSALPWSPLPGTGIVEVTNSHILSTQPTCFLCILRCSGRFNILLEHLFPLLSINNFQKKKELRNSRLCVWRPQDCKMLARVEHCFDLMKPEVLLETFISWRQFPGAHIPQVVIPHCLRTYGIPSMEKTPCSSHREILPLGSFGSQTQPGCGGSTSA